MSIELLRRLATIAVIVPCAACATGLALLYRRHRRAALISAVLLALILPSATQALATRLPDWIAGLFVAGICFSALGLGTAAELRARVMRAQEA